jgi:urease accessory protein
MALTTALISPALAHTGVGPIDSFTTGIAHPLGGLDHIVTMFAVGLWSVLTGGRAAWIWPTAFITTMLAGFAATRLGVGVVLVEPAICTSIVVFGLCVALAVRSPVWLGAIIVGFFAFFHGHAHGTEAVATSAIPYVTGFALATASLHLAGIGLGLFLKGSTGTVPLRAIGEITVLVGLALIGS